MPEPTVIMDENSVNRTLSRLAHEIIEADPAEKALYLIGIRRRGISLAKSLSKRILAFSDMQVVLGELDITQYRDDLHEKTGSAFANDSPLTFDITGKTVVLVDDVLCTGRTARAAIDALLTWGRPAKIRLCVLVDRGHRELPIRGDYVGKNVPTSHREQVCVRVPEFDGTTEVVILKSDI